MSKFLGLWNQFAASTDRKLQRFHSADSEFISQMENDIKQKLGGSESAVNATSAQIAGLKTRIQMSMKDEIEYENQFTVKIQELKDTLKRLNNDRTSHNLESNDLVNEFENYEIENMGSLKENVKQLIDAFGQWTGLRKGWFHNLTDRPALQKARKVKGVGGKNWTEPMFCPYEVMDWLCNGPRRSGRKLREEKGWEILERVFPKVYEARSDMRPD